MVIYTNEILANCGSSRWLMETTLFALTFVMSLVKTISFRANNAMNHSLLRSSHEDWVVEKNAHYVQILREYAKMGRLFCLAQWTNFIVGVTYENIMTIVAKRVTKNEEEMLPLRTFCTFGAPIGWAYFGVYFFQLVQVQSSENDV